MSCGLNPICHGGNLIGDAIGSAAGSAIDALADSVTEAVGKVVATLGTVWVKVDTPDLTTAPGGTAPSDSVAFIQGSLEWYMLAGAVVAVIVGGTRMAWLRRAEPGVDLLKALFTLILVTGAGLGTVGLLVAAADELAQWIITRSIAGTDFGSNMTALLGFGAVNALGSLLVILLGLAAIFSSIFQIALMIVRGGMLVILTGTLPTSASATNTEMGKAWFKKNVGWLVAFILYKPTAAIVYATAFRLAGADVGGDDGLMKAVTGLVLMVLAILALPALLRFVNPFTAALAGGGGGGGSAAAAAALPTGAMMISRGGGSGGAPASAGASGDGGPTGAAGSTGGRGSPGSNGSSPPGGGGGGGGAPSSPAGGGAGAGAGSAAGTGAAAGPAGAAVGAGAAAARGASRSAQGAASTSAGDGAVPSGAGGGAPSASGGGGASGAAGGGAAGGGAARPGAGPVVAGAAGVQAAAQAARHAAQSQTGDEDGGPRGSS